MRKPKKDKLSAFEVAMEDDNYELPRDVPAKFTFIDNLIAFITFYERLGTPGPETLYKLGKLKSHKGNIKETAMELDIDPASLYKWLKRLEERYNKKIHPPVPNQQQDLTD
jgi:hypothetical protein